MTSYLTITRQLWDVSNLQVKLSVFAFISRRIISFECFRLDELFVCSINTANNGFDELLVNRETRRPVFLAFA